MDTLTRMRAFIDVVEAEGFSAAARRVGRSKALMSKYVRELEDELGALLLNRTTRQFSLTEAGHTYYQRASELIREIDSLADTIRDTSGDVRGRIKLSAPRSFADARIGQSLIDFARDYPDIVLDIHLDDRFVDLVEEGFDLAIRIARLADSSMIARKLSPFRLRICATPDALERFGTPQEPSELADRPCIVDTNGRWLSNWPFVDHDGKNFAVSVLGRMEVNSPLPAKAATLSGLGFCMVPEFVVDDELRDGALVSVLDDYVPSDGGIYAVYPHRRYLPGKVRTFVDYLAKWFRDNPRERHGER